MGFKRYEGMKAAWSILKYDGQRIALNVDFDIATTDYHVGIKFNCDEYEYFRDCPNFRLDLIWVSIHFSWFRR